MRINFSIRLVLFTTILVALTVGLSSILVYQAGKRDLQKSLTNELLAIARSTSTLVDGDLVELIYRNDSGAIEFREEFEVLREQLDQVRLVNSLPRGQNPIYIMRPMLDYRNSGELEFVAMPDRDEFGNYFVGNTYAAEPHNRRTLEGQASASELYTDREGVWLSASAPIFNSQGVLVGLVQVDRPVNFFYSEARSQAYQIFLGAFLSIGVGVALAMLFARSLMRPLQHIASAVRELGDGNLDRRVWLRRYDEIGDLAEGFNRMADRLQQDRQKLEHAQEKAEIASRALVVSGRLAAVGQLAAGVAHEINNPLTYVRANLVLLRGHWEGVQKLLEGKDLSDESLFLLEEGEELIEESMEGVERAVAIVRDIKGFAHSGSISQEEVDLIDLLNSVLRVAAPQIASEIEVRRNFGAAVCIRGSGQELKQVFLNVIINASQAISGRGTISLSVEVQDGFAIVSIDDDGHGIEGSVIDRLFDPFFTTKPVGQGTGLGLSISFEIIRRHGGEIRVESELGRGTRFSIHLPLRG